MALTAPRAKTGPAAALLRAYLIRDIPTGILIMDENCTAKSLLNDPEALELVLSVLDVADRWLVASHGGNVAKTLRLLDSWIAEGDRERAAP